MIVLATALLAAQAAPAAQVTALPDCGARLAVLLDDGGGEFNGMSHSGVRLILRNAGRAACKVPGLPTLSFLTRSGAKLPVTRRPPVGMRPGPVVPPVALESGASASTALRWVSGNVFDNGRCLTPARVVVQAGALRRVLPFGRQLCGQGGAAIPLDQPVLTPGDGAPG